MIGPFLIGMIVTRGPRQIWWLSLLNNQIRRTNRPPDNTTGLNGHILSTAWCYWSVWSHAPKADNEAQWHRWHLLMRPIFLFIIKLGESRGCRVHSNQWSPCTQSSYLTHLWHTCMSIHPMEPNELMILITGIPYRAIHLNQVLFFEPNANLSSST